MQAYGKYLDVYTAGGFMRAEELLDRVFDCNSARIRPRACEAGGASAVDPFLTKKRGAVEYTAPRSARPHPVARRWPRYRQPVTFTITPWPVMLCWTLK